MLQAEFIGTKVCRLVIKNLYIVIHLLCYQGISWMIAYALLKGIVWNNLIQLLHWTFKLYHSVNYPRRHSTSYQRQAHLCLIGRTRRSFLRSTSSLDLSAGDMHICKSSCDSKCARSRILHSHPKRWDDRITVYAHSVVGNRSKHPFLCMATSKWRTTTKRQDKATDEDMHIHDSFTCPADGNQWGATLYAEHS